MGAMLAAVVGFFSVFMGLSQVAVGFVLTLTARDLAYFLGNPYARLYGPQAGVIPIPWLSWAATHSDGFASPRSSRPIISREMPL